MPLPLHENVSTIVLRRKIKRKSEPMTHATTRNRLTHQITRIQNQYSTTMLRPFSPSLQFYTISCVFSLSHWIWQTIYSRNESTGSKVHFMCTKILWCTLCKLTTFLLDECPSVAFQFKCVLLGLHVRAYDVQQSKKYNIINRFLWLFIRVFLIS